VDKESVATEGKGFLGILELLDNLIGIHDLCLLILSRSKYV